MEPEPGAAPRRDRNVYLAFVALAVLAGPVRSYTSNTFYPAMHWETFTGSALSSMLAGAVLVLLSVARRQPMLRGKQWLALLALLLPQWLLLLLTPPYVRSIPMLHETPWGVGFLLMLAAPLWLGLLSAMELVPTEVPRAVAGAAIAGMGAVFLVVPVEAMRVMPNQSLVLALELLLNIAVVFSWAYAAPRLAGSKAAARTLAVAGWFLLLSALGDTGFAVLFERGWWQPIDWRAILLPLLMDAAVGACSCWLWFWLLQRMTLPAFAMRALATWTATILPGFVLFGFMSWRVDVALAVALAALAIALRARGTEEQPLALGLRGG